MAGDIERNKAIVSAFAEAINDRDWDRLDELVAADFIRHSTAAGTPGVHNRNDLKQYLSRELQTFPDALETIEDTVAERDRVAVRHGFRGTQRGRWGRIPLGKGHGGGLPRHLPD